MPYFMGRIQLLTTYIVDGFENLGKEIVAVKIRQGVLSRNTNVRPFLTQTVIGDEKKVMHCNA